MVYACLSLELVSIKYFGLNSIILVIGCLLLDYGVLWILEYLVTEYSLVYVPLLCSLVLLVNVMHFL